MNQANVTGYVGEHLVAADLLKNGFRVSFASAGYPYDLIAERDGKAYFVQVKSTDKPRSDRSNQYIFSVNTEKKYRLYDLIAFIALDCGAIGYLPKAACATGKAIFQLPNSNYHARRKGRNLDDNTLEQAVSEVDSTRSV